MTAITTPSSPRVSSCVDKWERQLFTTCLANKKILLHECKRHSARAYQEHRLSSYPEGVPHPWLGGTPSLAGVPSSWPPGQDWGTPRKGPGTSGSIMRRRWVPPGVDWQTNWNYYLPHPSDTGGKKIEKKGDIWTGINPSNSLTLYFSLFTPDNYQIKSMFLWCTKWTSVNVKLDPVYLFQMHGGVQI